MTIKRQAGGASNASRIPILLVGPESPSLDRSRSVLEGASYGVTTADNVCYAEMFADQQYFEAAIFAAILPLEEQASLARVMRVRWPWMRLISCSPDGESELFDATQLAESQLAETLSRLLL